MWMTRLSSVLGQPFELISLEPCEDAPFRGRYLHLADAVLGLGRLIATGGEALVYELIDLESSNMVGVVKICRFPPGTPEYQRWAVPIRFEGNARSRLADIEMCPSRLVEVAGGWVKVQDYVSVDTEDDWALPTAAGPIFAPGLELQERLEVADALLGSKGEHGVLLEGRGIILAELERDEEAVDSLERAMELFRTESLAGVLRVAPLLASCHRRLYHRVRWQGASVVMTVPGLGNQIVYADGVTAARDDTIQDRSLYVAFEALDVEPYSIPNLAVLAEELMSSWLSIGRVDDVLEAIERAAPGHGLAEEIRQERDAIGRERKETLEKLSVDTAGDPDRGGDELPATELEVSVAAKLADAGSSDESATENLQNYMVQFDEAYRPEPERGQTVEARVVSALANLGAGRFGQAEAAARSAIALDPSYAEAHLALSRVFCATDRFVEAESLLAEAIAAMPSEGDIYAELGAVQLFLDKFAEARTALLRALVCEPSDPWDVRFQLGRACRKLGLLEEAKRWLRRCILEEPARPKASIELAYAMRSDPEPDIDGAQHVISEALAINRSDVELLVCRAQLFAWRAHWKEAVCFLEQAVAISPHHEIAAQFLLVAREQLGNSDD